MKIKNETKYKVFLSAVSAFGLTTEDLTSCLKKVERKALPHWMRFDFNSLVFGRLAQLQRLKTGGDMLTKSFYVVLAPEKGWFAKLLFAWRMSRLKTADALAFISRLTKDMERCAKLFAALKYEGDADEKRAGIDKLSGGMHNIADWYARRMGFSDIEQVYKLSWVRIYKAMKDDYDNNNYVRRLRRIKEERGRK